MTCVHAASKAENFVSSQSLPGPAETAGQLGKRIGQLALRYLRVLIFTRMLRWCLKYLTGLSSVLQ